jgi:glutamine amidotransferase
MQNGQIGGYESVRRELEHKIPAELYCERRGSTDSEAFFLLACGNGLDVDVRDALQRTVAQVLQLMENEGVNEPFRLTAAIAEGKRIHSLRYSSDNQSPTLFYASGGTIRVDDGQVEFTEGNNAVLILSEPLDGRIDGWTEVPDGHILEACSGGGVKIRSFQP